MRNPSALPSRPKCIGLFIFILVAIPVVTACSARPAPSAALITPNEPVPLEVVPTPTAFMPLPSIIPTEQGIEPPTQAPTLTSTVSIPTSTPGFTSTPTLVPTITGEVEWTEAGGYVGENRTVCGPVAGTHFAKDSNGQPTFLNVGEDYPSPQRFVVLIWGDDRPNFPFEPEVFYEGKTICATGDIQEYQGTFEVEVRSPDAVEIQR